MRKNEDHKRVGIWIRVSTDDQVKGESPEHHEARARQYAEVKRWNVVEVYRRDAVSGKTVQEHPEAKRMLADIKRGHISGLVFSKLARLARNTRELLEFHDHFRRYDAGLFALDGEIDMSTSIGKMLYTVKAATAE
jgi:site-specific DNA recombinase